MLTFELRRAAVFARIERRPSFRVDLQRIVRRIPDGLNHYATKARLICVTGDAVYVALLTCMFFARVCIRGNDSAAKIDVGEPKRLPLPRTGPLHTRLADVLGIARICLNVYATNGAVLLGHGSFLTKAPNGLVNLPGLMFDRSE